MIKSETGGSTIVASGLAGKTSAVDLQGAEESRWLQVQKLLNWMCREYARCLHTLKQAAVEHKCTTMGNKEIQESHTELMVMQLERKFFFSLRYSHLHESEYISLTSAYISDILTNCAIEYMLTMFKSTPVYMKAVVHGDVMI